MRCNYLAEDNEKLLEQLRLQRQELEREKLANAQVVQSFRTVVREDRDSLSTVGRTIDARIIATNVRSDLESDRSDHQDIGTTNSGVGRADSSVATGTFLTPSSRPEKTSSRLGKREIETGK